MTPTKNVPLGVQAGGTQINPYEKDITVNKTTAADIELERRIRVESVTGEVYTPLYEWSVDGGEAVYSATPIVPDFDDMHAGTVTTLSSGEQVTYRGRWHVVDIEDGVLSLENSSLVPCQTYGWCEGDLLEGPRTNPAELNHLGADVVLGYVWGSPITAARTVNADCDGHYIAGEIRAEVDPRDLFQMAEQLEAVARSVRALIPDVPTPAKRVSRRSSK